MSGTQLNPLPAPVQHAHRASKEAILASLAAGAALVRDDRVEEAAQGLEVVLEMLRGHQRLQRWAEQEENDDDAQDE